MRSSASKGHWREAHRKQWVTFIGLLELRNYMEACIIWIQDERVVVVGPWKLILEGLLCL
jgi:hypothetical protein